MPVLYHLTLQKPTAIVHALQGNFSAPRAQEVVVSRGRILELLRPDDQGKLQAIASTEVFGIIRSIAAFRLTGANRDYLAVGSDSGRLVIVQFSAEKNEFERVHCETYGKTGVRRVVPGEYLAVDPKGRSLMVAAVERQKFVYIVNRDNKAQLTISSPLEAHKSHAICHDLCGIDMSFDNPLFASLEQNVEATDKKPATPGVTVPKGVCLWEMDLGLNHVIKKATLPVPPSAHCLIPVPGGGGADGPSGVLVCCGNFLLYKKPDHEEISCAIPRRLETGSDRGLVVVAFAVHRMKDFFFILIQTEYGDIYKVEISHEEGVVREIVCRYFDTVPVANALCVLKSGYLFVASEFGNHLFYQFTGIGSDASDPRCSSTHPLGREAIIAFKPRPLKNLALVDELPSLSPITDLKVLDAQGTGAPQVYALCGKGPRSSLRILQHGLGVEEMADNELPGRARAVWTTKLSHESAFDGYIIVAFEGSSLVLQIGDTVEEVTDSLFLTNVSSLLVALMYDDSFIQVHETGIRHILKSKRINEWRAPGGRRIKAADANDRQLVISLSGGELVLFEVDDAHTLVETARRNINVETTCMSIQATPKGRLRASFLAVGGLDNMVRILSLEKDRNLRQLATQLLPNNATPESVCLVTLTGLGTSNTEKGKTNDDAGILYLHVGLNTGIMIRSVVDPVLGTLLDQRSRFLGGRAVRFHAVTLGGQPAILALSEKSWLCYTFQHKLHCTPLNYDPLECVASFSSEQCVDGFVAIAGGSLRIFRCQRLGETFSQTVLPLSFTPRAMTALPHLPATEPHDTLNPAAGDVEPARRTAALAIVEADHNAYDESTKAEIRRALKGIKVNQEEEEEKEETDDMQLEEKEQQDLPEDLYGTFKAGEGKWGSCIRIVNPLMATTMDKVALETDEAALSCCYCEMEGLPLLIVGTVTAMTLHPRKVPQASIKVFSYDERFTLNLLHSTAVEDYPMALAPFRGMLLAGVGPKLRLYALGKKRLLKKCEYKNLPCGVAFIRVAGDRIFVGDLRESVHVMRYRLSENLFYVLADDVIPRWLTKGEVLDYHTFVAADKFDSIFICRVPSEAKQEELGDATGLRLRGDTTYLTDKCFKLQNVLQFHIGETVTALERATLTSGASECVVYGTVMGAIGSFCPFLTKHEMDLFTHLEMVLRTEKPPLGGREHIMFRSYYHPVKNTVDGDLCESYALLPADVQKRIAQDFEKTPAEILKHLEDIRNRIL
ncbi:putative splicing factor 3b, subunit 3 [Besnoitia besnoiti]|uniref:Putative splicing factor 3b, subunit 3 n=1 Tax=Besnoitia besnoiti TaxID=94643 RepID=A0A2A9ML43_BESBE|nr:putative splicing factor 3b, subunit 3 [Besnoitia besnoiti]PFH38689.1 putative splicing factor 3b, subunit 3 [Besnoitia besnoiti]